VIRRGSVALWLALAATAGIVGRAGAQTCSAPTPNGSCTASTTTTMTVGTVLQLALSASATALTSPGTAEYDAGLVADNGPAATVKANRAWTLHIAAAAATWTAANTQPGVVARSNKPASDLQGSTSSGGSFAGMTVGGVVAGTGGATGGTTTTFYFHTLYSWSLDTPGAYALPVVFTLTAP
jgi:hypothetical protein